jgi:hypothetical protein
MDNKKSVFGYIFAGILGAIAGAVSMIGLGKMIPNMMVNCMKKMREEGIEPPECCKEMMKTSGKKQKK